MLCIILFYFYSTYELSCLRRCSQCNLIRATSPSPHQKRKVFRERVEVIELPAMIRVRVKARKQFHTTQNYPQDPCTTFSNGKRYSGHKFQIQLQVHV